ncbi:hypothetical protein LJB42_003198 [Komagataella kurtzmanii]|nr:hypothetical protein LJB42_003198 [Komagataella kurtzmanii]
MGVTGLLPAIKNAQKPTNLESFRGSTLAIDTYAWLHRATTTSWYELSHGVATKKYIQYVMKRVEMLFHFQITPYFVFDGDYLPCKAETEAKREARRKEYRKLGDQAQLQGNRKLAMNYYQKCCDVTPEMAKALIDEFKARQISFVVAPYEADAQMVYLEMKGFVDGIISEDSDLLVFGSRSLITKLNDRGECIHVQRNNLKDCANIPGLAHLSQHQFRIVASLSGCDYTKGIPGIGVIKAFQLVRRYESIDKIFSALRLDGKFKIPASFETEYRLACLAFQFQLVFDPKLHKPVHLTDIPKDLHEDLDLIYSCAGPRYDDSLHVRVAYGELNPITKEPLISREIMLQQNQSSFCTQKPAINTTLTAKRFYTSPDIEAAAVPQLSTPNIDSFFKRRLTATSKVQTSIITQKKSGPIAESSPANLIVSKRKKLFLEEEEFEEESSRFFKSKSGERKIDTLEGLNSSDFELSDVDTDKENQEPHTTTKDENTGVQLMTPIPSVTCDWKTKYTLQELPEFTPSKTAKRVLKPSGNRKKGINLPSPSAASTPLKSLKDSSNSITLDRFIFRG